MKLLSRHYSSIRFFLLCSCRNSCFPKLTDSINGMSNIKYFKFDTKDFIPKGAEEVGNGVFRQMFTLDQTVCRTTSTLLRDLFSGVCATDSGGVKYLSGPGMIADEHGIPLLFVLTPTADMKRRGYKFDYRLVINSYVFRRENSFSKFILDTLYPTLATPSYRKSMFEDTTDYNITWRRQNLPSTELVFRDISEDFWINEPLDIVLDEQKIRTFTEDFCENFVKRAR